MGGRTLQAVGGMIWRRLAAAAAIIAMMAGLEEEEEAETPALLHPHRHLPTCPSAFARFSSCSYLKPLTFLCPQTLWGFCRE